MLEVPEALEPDLKSLGELSADIGQVGSLAVLAEAVDEDSSKGLSFAASEVVPISLAFLAFMAFLTLLTNVACIILFLFAFIQALEFLVFRRPWEPWVSRGPWVSLELWGSWELLELWGPWGSVVSLVSLAFSVSVGLLVVVQLMIESKLVESRLVVVEEQGVTVSWIPYSEDPQLVVEDVQGLVLSEVLADPYGIIAGKLRAPTVTSASFVGKKDYKNCLPIKR